MQTFEELSDIFSDHNNYLTSRELLMRVGVASSNHTRALQINDTQAHAKPPPIPVTAPARALAYTLQHLQHVCFVIITFFCNHFLVYENFF